MLRPARAVLAILLAIVLAAALLLPAPRPARADAVSGAVEAYTLANAALEELLVQREAAIQRLERAVAAEQAALARFGEAQARLEGLRALQASITAGQEDLAGQLAAAEAAVRAAGAERANLARRLDAYRHWIAGPGQPPGLAPADLEAAAALLDDLQAAQEDAAAAQAAAQAAVAGIEAARGATVDRLGQANTEIAWWEGQADARSREVGAARSRALAASAQVARLQGEGASLAVQVQAQADALRAAGHPVGVVAVAGVAGLPGAPVPPEAVPEPVPWPQTAPRYVLPAGGQLAAALRAGPPLPAATTREDLLASGALEGLPPLLVPLKGAVTTPYGGDTPYQPAHWAVDIAADLYAPVAAAADGVVEYAGLAAPDSPLASYGMVVLLRHNDQLTSVYAHLDDRGRGVPVKAGDTVRTGQIVGYVGLTGLSTGPHLHWEVRVGNRPVDPLKLLPQPGAQPGAQPGTQPGAQPG